MSVLRLGGPWIERRRAELGVEGLADAFGIDRTKLWRWLAGKTAPKRLHEVFRIAKNAGVDPVCLVDLRTTYYDVVSELLTGSANEHWIRDLFDLVRGATINSRHEQWPPDQDGLGPWTRHYFSHAGEHTNTWAALALEASTDPQVWHFSFSNKGPTERFYQPYGIIMRLGSAVELFDFTGIQHQIVLSAGDVSFAAATWFGPTPTNFQVASIGAFRLHVSPATGDGISLRFG